MLKNYDKHHLGNIDFNVTIKAVDAVLKFLDFNLPAFPKFFMSIGLSNLNEDLITSKLEIFLQRQARSSNEIFMFQFQSPESNSRRSTDMSILYASPYSSSESFFTIEAKRLPTPGGKDREREYVQGNLGAIERFKRGHHATGLRQSAIFGYVEKNDYNYWHFKICSWIKDLIKNNTDSTILWDDNDLLTSVKNINGMNLYQSVNGRFNSEHISLTHYWIKII